MTAILDELDRRTTTRSTLLEDLQKLYKVDWPPVGSDELVLFGEESVNRLAKRFGLSARSMVKSFRKYKNGKLQSQFVNLLAAAETFPGSTAECERGFSAMNETVWDKRSQMKVDIVSSTMFIKLNGVSISKFNPHPYVRSWIAAGNRLSTSWLRDGGGSGRPAGRVWDFVNFGGSSQRFLT